MTVMLTSSMRRSFRVKPHVEPEISIMILILHLVCILTSGHVTVIMTSSMKLFFHVSKSDKVYMLWYLKNLRYQVWFSSGLQIVSRPRDIHDNVIYEITFPCLQVWQSLNVAVHLELEISNLVIILFLICKIYTTHNDVIYELLSHAYSSDKVWKSWYL